MSFTPLQSPLPRIFQLVIRRPVFKQRSQFTLFEYMLQEPGLDCATYTIIASQEEFRYGGGNLPQDFFCIFHIREVVDPDFKCTSRIVPA